MFKNWFYKTKYPKEWLDYLETFIIPNSNQIDQVNFVVLDTETTGLHKVKDRILSLGALRLKDNKIMVRDCIDFYLKQEKFNPETVPIHEILKSGKSIKIEESDAVFKFLAFVKNSIIVGHQISFDIAMIDQALLRMGLPKLKNKTLDTAELFKKTPDCKNRDKPYSLDELCTLHKMKLTDRHTALGDAYLTAILFLKIYAQIKKVNPSISLKDLLFKKPRRGLI
ncbi:MAG: 3'-5' exonuclease [Lutimonas sp.]